MTTTLPTGPTTRRALQGLYFVAARRKVMFHLRKRYGSAFMINLPIFGKAMVISDPDEVKQLFTTSPALADNVEVNLGRVLGPGALFALEGDAHKRQRKLLVPPFHGRRLKAYEAIVEDEAVREMATWPEAREFPVLESMMRITLNAILRAVFGAEGAEFDELRALLPKFVKLGSLLAGAPVPTAEIGTITPWGRFKAYRREYDAIIDRLIDKAEQGGNLEERDDVLAMMLQSTYEDGSKMSRSHIADELLTLLTAGHETTATTLAWVVERIRRHPDVLRQLVAEQDAGKPELREATILEVQRVRPVIDATARQIREPGMQLGRWTLPPKQVVIVSIMLLHDNADLWPNPRQFDPNRFYGEKPETYSWIPFGGGTRRCIGAAFANMEMNVVLQTLLRDFTIEPTTARNERWHSRGVAFAPAKGGRAVVRRRPARPRAEIAAAAAEEVCA